MKLTIILLFISQIAFSQSKQERALHQLFPGVDFSYYWHNPYHKGYKNSKSIVKVGVRNDSVFACYWTKRKSVDHIKWSYRYFTDSLKGETYSGDMSNREAVEITLYSNLRAVMIYISSPLDLQLDIKEKYYYDFIFREHTPKKEFILYEYFQVNKKE